MVSLCLFYNKKVLLLINSLLFQFIDEQLIDTKREVKILSELNSEFVVKYITAWTETKLKFKRTKNYAFIQMQLCSQSLREVITSLDRITDDRHKTFKYFISCELFRELTECVHYLHSLRIPIIHRDLKPENVLISDGSDGHFLKLCDFGLAKVFHQNSNNTSYIGTKKYRAPEMEGNVYNWKVDVYSLAVITTEIFCMEYSVQQIKENIFL